MKLPNEKCRGGEDTKNGAQSPPALVRKLEEWAPYLTRAQGLIQSILPLFILVRSLFAGTVPPVTSASTEVPKIAEIEPWEQEPTNE